MRRNHQERINVHPYVIVCICVVFHKSNIYRGNALFITSFLRTVLERNLVELEDTYFYTLPIRAI